MKSVAKMSRYILDIASFEPHFCKTMCALLESQILVDMTVTCKSYSVKVHKSVLAARSEYFRDKLQKDVSIDSVLINDMRPSVLRSLISFIYCGKSSIALDDLVDVIYAGKFFQVSGIDTVAKETVKLDASAKSDLNLVDTPPLFFSNNVKVNAAKGSKPSPASVVSAKCHAPSSSKEARCLLVKEQVASEQALKEVQRNKSKLVITQDTSTVVTVEADLAAGFAEPIQVQEFLIENFNKPGLKPTLPEDGYGDQINEVYVLQPDDENFVDNNARVFEELSHGHTVSYQLIPQNKGDLEIQEYICNTIGDYGVNAATNICFIPEDPEPKYQMTYAQLSSDAVDYITTGDPNIGLDDQTVAVNQQVASGGDGSLSAGTETGNTATDNYESRLASDADENCNESTLFEDFENTKSLDVMTVSQRTPFTGNELIVVADSFDEDSSKSMFEQSVEWEKNPMLTYHVEEFGDNAVEYVEKRRSLKRKPGNKGPCADITNANSFPYLDLDEANLVKYAKQENCSVATSARQSPALDQTDSVFAEIVPETQDINANSIPLQEADRQDKPSVNRHTKTAFDILSFGEARADDVRTQPNENRRQTRSLTKRRPSSLGF